ncbi:MAG: hypothetical protein IKT27_04670 [Clostridia bacterium]|nr:hypothetical protein [Clostridia bacterium]
MSKFLVISLAKEFGDQVAKNVADKLNLKYLNIDKYVQYSIAEPEKMLEKCGKEYYNQQVVKHLEVAIGFEDTLFFCGYSTFMKNQPYFFDFQKIYLGLSLKQLQKLDEKDKIINKIAFPDRHRFLSKNAKKVKSRELNVEAFANLVIKEANK